MINIAGFQDGGQACIRREVDVCNTNCKDHLYQDCQSEVVFDCACPEGKYLTQNGTCVSQDQCGCYDFTQPDEYFESGETSTQGCRQCTCNGHVMACRNTCEDVTCPNGQVSKTDVLLSGEDTNCTRKMCPRPYYSQAECIDVESSANMCFCSDGKKQTRV
ncbi:SCO-spondin [Elysia marginata]|uniref:SCO-spondin n=1 Tax=Elysia marginata TaxID=1093978 RepID=A0AAV4HA92_9GAST|nr:SCO-spondin [Elysia marginata]